MKLCFTLLLFCFLFAPSTGKAQVNTSDSLALVDFYNSTNGDSWLSDFNWLNGPVNTWFGVLVEGNRVVQLDLASNRLSGSLVSSFGNLTAMRALSLAFNDIGGNIPQAIGNLTTLTFLDFSGNNFTGAIPSSIGNLVNLTYLGFFYNPLSGSLPQSIGNLTKLQTLAFSDCAFTGAIPSSFGNLVNLVTLELRNNKLSGDLPSSLSSLVKLSEFSVGVNKLTGAFPDFVIDFPNLQYFDISRNSFTGEVPNELFKKKKLGSIDISSNKLSFNENIRPWTGNQNRNGVYVNNNLFTFNGLEYIATRYYDPQYTPQAQVKIHKFNDGLAVSAGGSLKSNTYIWFKVGDSVPVKIIADSTFKPAASGRYYAKIKNAVATKLVLLTDTVAYTLSNIFVTENATSNQLKQHLIVYPNPARNVINVQADDATITIINSNGRILLTQKIAGKATIDISKFANGYYYIQNLSTGEKEKFVIVH